MPEEKLPYTEFAKKIKAKYPDYADMDDLELSKKMVAKYPEYAEQVDLALKKKAEATPSPSPLTSPPVYAGGESGLANGASVPSGIDYMKGQNFVEPKVPTPSPIPQTQPTPVVDAQGFTPTAPPAQLTPEQQQSMLSSAGTTQGVPIDQTQQIEIPKSEINNGSSLAAGLNTAASVLARSPSGAWDILSHVTNFLINRPIQALGAPIGDLPSSNQLSQQTGIDSPLTEIADNADAYVTAFNKKQQETYDRSITDYFAGDKPDYKKGFEAIGKQIIQAIPTSMAIAGASMYNPAASAAVFGSGFSAQKKKELDDNPELANMPENEKIMWSTLSGATELASEQLFGAVKFVLMLKNVYKTAGKEGLEEVSKSIFKSTYGKPIARYFGISAEEGLTEGANKFAQNVFDKISGNKPDIDLKEGVMDATIIGFAMGGAMGAAPTIGQIAVNRKARKEASKLQEEKAVITQDIEREGITEETKVILSSKLQDINEREVEIAEEEKALLKDLSETKLAQINALTQKADQIEAAIKNDDLSDESKQILEKDLDGIGKQIEEVVKEKEPEPVVTKTETPVEDTQSEIDYLTSIKESGIPLSTDEEARLLELVPNKTAEEIKTEETPVSTAAPITQGEPVTAAATQEPVAVNEEVVQEKSLVNEIEMPPRIKGGPKQFYKKDTDGIWKQKVGNELSAISPRLQEELQAKADEMTPKTTPVEPAANVDTKPDIQAEPIVVEETPKPKKEPVKQELIDEEELPSIKEDDVETVKKLNDDITLMKGFEATEKVDKKFEGMLERAYVAWKDKKISYSTYTSFKNKAKDVLEGKHEIAKKIDYVEAKAISTAMINKVKEKLIGKGYKKITMASMSPITPQTIDDLLTLVNNIIHRGIDAKMNIDQATAAAMKAIKNHPLYKKLLDSGELDEKAFSNAIKASKKQETSPEPQPKKGAGKNDSEDSGITGGKRKRKIAARQKANPAYKEITDSITDEDYNMYDRIDQKKANQYINDKIKEYEAAGAIEELAQNILDDDSPFPDQLSLKAPILLADRIRVLAESEGNETTKNMLNKLAGDLSAKVAKDATPAAQKIGLLSDINKTLPLSVDGVKEFARQKMSENQDMSMNKAQKKEFKEAMVDINSIMETEEVKTAVEKAVESEIERISNESKGVEWTQKAVKSIESLEINLADC